MMGDAIMANLANKGVRTVGASEMARILGISVNTFNVHRRNGLPSARRGKYEPEAVCRWAISQPRHGKMWESATLYLSALQRQGGRPRNGKTLDDGTGRQKITLSVVELPKTRPPDGEAAEGEKALLFSPILDKFRNAVDYLAERFKEARQTGDYDGAAEILKAWGPAFDTLRKAEESVLELERQRAAMLPRDDVRAAFSAFTSNLRGRLLDLPRKLAHGLTNAKSADGVMMTLDAEIRGSLEAVARDPFGNGT